MRISSGLCRLVAPFLLVAGCSPAARGSLHNTESGSQLQPTADAPVATVSAPVATEVHDANRSPTLVPSTLYPQDNNYQPVTTCSELVEHVESWSVKIGEQRPSGDRCVRSRISFAEACTVGRLLAQLTELRALPVFIETYDSGALADGGAQQFRAFTRELRARGVWPAVVVELKGSAIHLGHARPFPLVRYCISLDSGRRAVLLQEYGRRAVTYAPTNMQ